MCASMLFLLVENIEDEMKLIRNVRVCALLGLRFRF